jgi:hypothetical protein
MVEQKVLKPLSMIEAVESEVYIDHILKISSIELSATTQTDIVFMIHLKECNFAGHLSTNLENVEDRFVPNQVRIDLEIPKAHP